MKARVIQVIETELEMRGDGRSEPYRRIKQYWTMEGELLAEVDPLMTMSKAPDLAIPVPSAWRAVVKGLSAD